MFLILEIHILYPSPDSIDKCVYAMLNKAFPKKFCYIVLPYLMIFHSITFHTPCLPNKKCRFHCIWIRKKILFCKGNKSLRIQSIRQQVYFARNVPRASVFKIAFLDTSKRLYYCLVKYYAPSSAHLALSARINIPIRRPNCFLAELKKKKLIFCLQFCSNCKFIYKSWKNVVKLFLFI